MTRGPKPLGYSIRVFARAQGQPPWGSWVDPRTGDYFDTTDRAKAETQVDELRRSGLKCEVVERSWWPKGHSYWCDRAHAGPCTRA